MEVFLSVKVFLLFFFGVYFVEGQTIPIKVPQDCEKNSCTITLDENNDEPTVLFTIDSATNPVVSFASGSATFRYDFTDKTNFSTQEKFDYETTIRYLMIIVMDSHNPMDLYININNLDDNPPTMTTENCEIPENDETTTCTYELTDLDTMIFDHTFSIKEPEEKDFFQFTRDPTVGPKEITAKVFLSLKKQLDYEKKTMHRFTLVVSDSNQSSKDLVVVINVKDTDDTDPVWTNYVNFKQITEEQSDTIELEAIDGDYGMNCKIIYEVQNSDPKNLLSYSSGTFTIGKIDRDSTPNIDTGTATVAAIQSTESPSECQDAKSALLTITFYVTDINDEKPTILKTTSEDPSLVIDFSSKDDSKQISLDIEENYAGNLPFKVEILDKDSVQFAQYDIELTGFDDAFQVVPPLGIMETSATISVQNAEKLDFETIEQIMLNFVVKDRDNPSFTDQLSININLIDINDNTPEYEGSTSFDILETVKKGEEVGVIHANDADAEDTKLQYELSETTYLTIDQEGSIKVAEDNKFDYDEQKLYVVYLTVSDKVNHTLNKVLTFNIKDVNNKPPLVVMGTADRVNETQEVGAKIRSVTARDYDTSAELTVEILWDQCKATKNAVETGVDIKNSLEIVSSKMSGTKYVDYNVDFKTTKKEALDYEHFDTLSIALNVTDLKTQVGERFTIDFVIISIADDNDNPPIISSDEFTIQDATEVDTIIGTILASDKDAYTDLTYSFKPVDKKYDWLNIEEATGMMKVKTKIDCDTTNLPGISYTVTVTDGKFSVPKTISFPIQDVNNKVPTVKLNNGKDTTKINENSPKGTPVSDKLLIDDKDRDEPFHTVVCTFKEDACLNTFQIKNDEIQVKDNAKLDCDEPVNQDSFSCTVYCYDDPDPSSYFHNSIEYPIVILVEDINDNAPVMEDQSFSSNEDVKENAEIGTIQASDADKTEENNKMSFKILSIELTDNSEASEENYKDLFILDGQKIVNQKPLQGFYGQFDLKVEVNDADSSHAKQATISIIVQRVNYLTPGFSFPDESSYTLNKQQTVGQALSIFNSDEHLKNIKFYDSQDKKCSGKWPNRKVAIKSVDSVSETYFTLQEMQETCEAQLQITDKFNPNTAIKITITFEVDLTTDCGSSPPAGQDCHAEIKTEFILASPDSDPFFENPNLNITFQENDGKASNSEAKARYDYDDKNTKIFFSILGDEEFPNQFKVDSKKQNCIISLSKPLDYEERTSYDFQIIASKQDDGRNDDPHGILQVHLDVEDVNDVAPKMVSSSLGSLGTLAKKGYTALQVVTEDPDTGTHITFEINEIKPNGNNINFNQPFELGQDNDYAASIKSTFDVEANMNGYFEIKLKFTDEVHSVPENLKIFILNSENTVSFRFENQLDEVLQKKQLMLSTIGDELGYQVNEDEINIAKSVREEDQTTITKATLFFVSDSTLEGSDAVMKQVTDTKVFLSLKQNLLKIGLLLLSFDNTVISPDNTVEILRNWLIGTACGLGAIIIIMGLVYFLRTRSLKKTITNLTKPKYGSQESGLNRLGINAPNANVYAAEGANPLYNTNVSHVEFDTKSITSGASSDLVGVEDNPEFEMPHPKMDEFI